ncbi:MAG: DEAD/DEAH box helicase, partial [Christensenellaceae bacterium]
MEEATEVQEKVATINSEKNKLLQLFEKEIFDIDYDAILGRYRTEYTSFFKYFKSSYKVDKKQLQSLYKDMSAKINDEIIISAINTLKKIAEVREWLQSNVCCFRDVFCEDFNGENTDFKKIEHYILLHKTITDTVASLNTLNGIAVKSSEMESNLIAHYSFLYNGLDTSWENIRRSLTWGVSFRAIVEKNNFGIAFVEKVCGDKEIVSLCGAYKDRLIQMKQDIDIEFVWYLKLFDDTSELKTTAFPDLIERISQCNNGLSLLEEWIDFRNARKSCREEGLSEYIEKIEAQKIAPSYILPIFQKRFFRLWLDAILPNYPAILNFRRINQENTIQEFASLDKIQFEIAKARIKSKLINDLPSFDHFTSGVDEISILKRELYKRRKIMPIRKLFQQIPNLLPTLKPCLMMSPLSVSLFLEAETYQFDTVIFDEASQVCTENAIGAIARGKQVIIAGDSKQLPPTNFFGASLSDVDYDTDDEDEDDVAAYESILDEANLLPERTLLWHYRSRHEHLIAFSNAKIYKNNLITFPSNVDKVPDNGVEYEYVREGFYDRGGKKGNVIEARRVAEIVFEHFKKHPNRSIGVIAFGEVQQQAIDTAIRKMRMENQMFESFFNEDKEEPFFVKNLENVQGDERDTIVFSVGYAKDENGVFRMNFGPLSKSGGERRLNVAITRAKYNVKLVGSILPTDINIEKITSDGP